MKELRYEGIEVWHAETLARASSKAAVWRVETRLEGGWR